MCQREVESALILRSPKEPNTQPDYPDKEKRLGGAPGAKAQGRMTGPSLSALNNNRVSDFRAHGCIRLDTEEDR